MGGLKTLLVVAVLGFSPPSMACAEDVGRLFASCAGRLSALMEHQFIVDGPASDGTKADRDRMVDLLEAVGEPGAQVMQWRLSAKVAQADLLARLRAAPDDLRLARRAEVLVADCLALMGGQS